MKVRRKPLVVEAVQITQGILDAAEFNGTSSHGIRYSGRDDNGRKYYNVQCRHGRVFIELGGWLVDDIDAVLYYPPGSGAFAAAYEPISEEARP